MNELAGPVAAPRGRYTRLLLLLLAATLALKLFLAWFYEGFLTGDDLEVVQGAAKYALGLNYYAWSLRCLFHPLVLVFPVLKVAGLLGARDPRVITWLAAVPTALFSTLSIALTAALARRWGWSERAAAAAAFLFAFAWLPLGYGATAFPRPISTALLLAAFLLADGSREGAGPAVAAGLLAAAAFAVRWSEGVVLLPLCGWTLWKFRSFRKVLEILGGFALGTALFVGVTDWLTWGSPFASLKEYFQIMYLHTPDVTTDPVWDYAYTAYKWAGPILLLLLIPAWKERYARPAFAVFASIVGLLSLFIHKEWRYLQAAIPFLAMAAAAGWERLFARGRRVLAAAALVLAVPYGVERSAALFSDRTVSETDASRFITSLKPKPRILALEQTWGYGEHLYLGNDVTIREIPLARPLRLAELERLASDADITAVYAMHLDSTGRRALERMGYRQIARFQRRRAYECLVFGRGPFAGPPDRPAGASQRPGPS